MLSDSQRKAAEHRLRYDTPFWAGGVTKDSAGRWVTPAPGAFRGCAKILNKQMQLVSAIARPWQLELDEILEKQRAEGLPMRVIILKSRQLGMCLDPSTRVLTADLRWVTLDDIQPGQRIVAVDETIPGGKGRARKLRVGYVEAKRDVFEPAFRLRFDDGRSVIATGPHRWLTRQVNGCADWRAVEDMAIGDEIRYVTKPWDDTSAEDGWMGGMLDGEGSVRPKEAVVCQRPGPVLDRARSYLAARGYHFGEQREHARESQFGQNEIGKLVVGRKNESLRLIGQTRPTRFVNDTSWWQDRDLPGKRTGIGWA